ncbi:MAG: hypothetical protein ACD_4C00028G0003 [uncultured bacterium (gcode 4)]|uniref:Peptidase M15C domain-containing protein n=1 Tax=uncultured bacterium (gcode 4) TaxID=1234023 RepID=K2F7N2_9BACT|nr:MAG: hypothetical protein ACD_4C00028G0003 [uncultured bacterium (gcode 4)]
MSDLEQQNLEKIEKINRRDKKKEALEEMIRVEAMNTQTQSVICDSSLKQDLLSDSFSAWIILEASINNPKILDKFKKDKIIANSEWMEDWFTVNFWANKSAERNIWLADLVDKWVQKVMVIWERHWREYSHIWVRQWLKWSFFDEQTGRYLPVFSWDMVRVVDRLSKTDLEKSEEYNKEIEVLIYKDDNEWTKEFLKKYSKKELDLIIKKSLDYWIDPCLLMALRSTENWWEFKEFWILKDDIDTYGSQLIFSCRVIQKNINRYQKTTGFNATESWRLSPEFLFFFSNIYAPIWASNDPNNLNENHLRNLLISYGKYSGVNFWSIDDLMNQSKLLIASWNEKNRSEKPQNSEKELFDFVWWSKESIENSLSSINFFWKNIQVHKYIATKLKLAEDDIRSDPEASQYLIKSAWWYCWRNKVSWNGLSMHALWLAIDINPEENWYQSWNSIDYRKLDIPQSFVEIMKRYWFSWWWNWKNPYDPMHFEFNDLALLQEEKLKA